jgi:integration host factor subunit beta
MTKSELVQRLWESNPHLYKRDAEIIVTAIFDEITAALLRATASNSAASARSQ